VRPRRWAVGADYRPAAVGGRAGQHRGPPRAGGGRAVHHVGDDARDVVRPAAADGQFHQLQDGLVPIRHRRQGPVQRLLADHPGQPVRAQQVPVTGVRFKNRQVRFGFRGPVQGAQQQGPLRMRGGLVRADPAVVDQRLNQGVVVRDLLELAARQQVGAGVPDMAPSDQSMAVSVVPIPLIDGSALTMSCRIWLACATAVDRAICSSFGGMSSSSSASVAMATALATSPAAWPPMPSATASRRGPA